MNLQEFKDKLSKDLYGMTTQEAIEKGICINCGKTPTFRTEEGKKEYYITAFCEPCFDKECKPGKDDEIECEYCHKVVLQEEAYQVEQHAYCSYTCYGHDIGF